MGGMEWCSGKPKFPKKCPNHVLGRHRAVLCPKYIIQLQRSSEIDNFFDGTVFCRPRHVAVGACKRVGSDVDWVKHGDVWFMEACSKNTRKTTYNHILNFLVARNPQNPPVEVMTGSSV